MTDVAATNRSYPLPRPDDHPRVTLGLLSDVADVLERHGYPRPRAGEDLAALQQALVRFLYAPPSVAGNRYRGVVGELPPLTPEELRRLTGE